MKLSKEDLRQLLKLYMEDHDLSFVLVNASFNHDNTKVIISITEDENID